MSVIFVADPKRDRDCAAAEARAARIVSEAIAPSMGAHRPTQRDRHPYLDATSITTSDVMARNSLKMLMAALSLAGITGVYLRQVTDRSRPLPVVRAARTGRSASPQHRAD
jgi:hypothetical protein